MGVSGGGLLFPPLGPIAKTNLRNPHGVDFFWFLPSPMRLRMELS